jgi:hypothetical protein
MLTNTQPQNVFLPASTDAEQRVLEIAGERKETLLGR